MADELSMDEKFIKKLHDILEANLENEQFGVSELAEEIGVSRSKLHRKLNALTGKSTSQFIREFRLEKAMDMLQNDVATGSEIAYRVGFGSPTYFNTSFKEYYGYPPGEVKFRNASTDKDNGESPKSKNSKKTFKQKSILAFSIAIVLLIALTYYFTQSSKQDTLQETSLTENNDKSIGLLPFKNLSNENANQYFADGVMVSIQNHLNKITDLKVISGTTMEKFRGTIKTAPEIAKELNISFLLEASAQKYGDTVRVIVHLIDAKNDVQKWSKDFEREFKNIFALESEIAKQVATELKLILSPNELQQIEKVPTKDLDAYNAYVKGRTFASKMGKENLEIGTKYFETAIEIDPEFALAIAGLSVAKLNLEEFGFIDKREVLKAKALAVKSLELDSTIAESHTALAILAAKHEWNWNEAEIEFKRSLKLNPNSVETHWMYSEYLQYVKGEFEEARKHIDKALLLDPLSYQVNMISAEYYVQAGDFEKAFRETLRAKEIDYNNTWAYWVNFINYTRQGKHEEAISELIKGWSLDSGSSNNINPVKIAYKQNGINGVFKWINDYDIKNGFDKVLSYWVAQKYAFLGEKEKALDYLKITYDLDPVELYRIKYDPFLENLRSEERFLKLLEIMGLEGY